MKKLLNVLYVTQPDVYISLDGENVITRKDDEIILRVPMHNLEGIVAFGYTGASPALMGACAERGIALSFLTMNGRFLAGIFGEEKGNKFFSKPRIEFDQAIFLYTHLGFSLILFHHAGP